VENGSSRGKEANFSQQNPFSHFHEKGKYIQKQIERKRKDMATVVLLVCC